MIYLSGKVRPDLPAMITPQMRRRPPVGQVWAADTGLYGAPKTRPYSDAGYLAFLERMPASSCLFATAPDVVGDAAATLALSAPMLRPIAQLGYRPALVAQDGLQDLGDRIPWAELGALFIGGTDRWRGSEAIHELAAEARRRGLWLHMGRVNTGLRYRLADSMSCDSVDGTLLAFGEVANRPRLAAWERDRHPMLWQR